MLLFEILYTIDSLPKAKAPDSDGFTGEYFKLFKQLLVPHLKELYNHSASLSSFPEGMLSALIITLPKPGKDPTSPRTFVPFLC